MKITLTKSEAEAKLKEQFAREFEIEPVGLTVEIDNQSVLETTVSPAQVKLIFGVAKKIADACSNLEGEFSISSVCLDKVKVIKALREISPNLLLSEVKQLVELFE